MDLAHVIKSIYQLTNWLEYFRNISRICLENWCMIYCACGSRHVFSNNLHHFQCIIFSEPLYCNGIFHWICHNLSWTLKILLPENTNWFSKWFFCRFKFWRKKGFYFERCHMFWKTNEFFKVVVWKRLWMLRK